MSQLHLDRCNAELRVGYDSSLGPEPRASDYDISEAQVLAIGDDWVFVPAADYCPVSDIPDWWPGTCGVFEQGDRMVIVGDNGMCAFHFKLTRQA